MPYRFFFKKIKTLTILSVLVQSSCLAMDTPPAKEILETLTSQELSKNSLCSRNGTEQETVIYLNNYFETLKKYNCPVDEGELDLCSNKMTFIPEIIFTLPSLGKLFFMSNKLTTINEKISNLKNLTTLHLSINAIIALPSAFADLPNLTELCLANNHLEDLPNNFSKLIKLRALNLSNNKLTILPLNFGHLTHLTELSLLNNPLRLPPSLPQNDIEKVLIHHQTAENTVLQFFLVLYLREGSTIAHVPKDIVHYMMMYFIQLTLTTEPENKIGSKNEIKELR